MNVKNSLDMVNDKMGKVAFKDMPTSFLMRLALSRWGMDQPFLQGCDAGTIRRYVKILFGKEIRLPGAPQIKALGNEGKAWYWDHTLGHPAVIMARNPHYKQLVKRDADGAATAESWKFAGESSADPIVHQARRDLWSGQRPAGVVFHLLHTCEGRNDWDGRAAKLGGPCLVGAILHQAKSPNGVAIAYGFFTVDECKNKRFPAERWHCCS